MRNHSFSKGGLERIWAWLNLRCLHFSSVEWYLLSIDSSPERCPCDRGSWPIQALPLRNRRQFDYSGAHFAGYAGHGKRVWASKEAVHVGLGAGAERPHSR